MPSVKSLSELIAGAGIPVLFVDTCTLLDMPRLALPKVSRKDAAKLSRELLSTRELLSMVLGSTPSCGLVISSLVRKEWEDNIEKVVLEVTTHLERLDQHSAAFHDACLSLEIPLGFGRAQYASSGLVESLHDLSRQLLNAAMSIDVHEESRARAGHRVLAKIPPAAIKQEWKDCVILEEYLSVCRALKDMGSNGKRVFCTSNKIDYLSIRYSNRTFGTGIRGCRIGEFWGFIQGDLRNGPLQAQTNLIDDLGRFDREGCRHKMEQGPDQLPKLPVAEVPSRPESSSSPVPREAARRQTVEFLILLGIGILLLRTFAAEAYVVPTGSMAPTLLGFHKELTCPNCKYPFVVGMDEQGRTGRPICPNCGQDGLGRVEAVECNGDRLLVQKFLFDFRRPRRWEVAVFHSPSEPDQAYVKRVVGLPGESVQIVDGDLFINGQIARKSLAEQRAMRILVFDNDYVPADSDRFPRWRFRGDRFRRAVPSGWKAEGTQFVHEPTRTSEDREDWLEYLHWDPDRSRHGPIRDFCPYNGGDVRGDNVVRDLIIEADIAVRS